MATQKQRKAARKRLERDQEAARERPASEKPSKVPTYHGRPLTAKEIHHRNLISKDEAFWEKHDRNERDLKRRNAKNTRMLFIRYASSALFFVNLYWFSMLLLSDGGIMSAVPAFNLVLFGAAAIESFWILYRDTEYLVITRWVTTISMLVDIALITVTLLMGKDLFFPFFSTGYVGVAALAIALALKLGVVCKVLRVRDRRDKAYDRYVQLISEI